VWKRGNVGSCLRPWIAMVAAYALALQVLLTGVAAGHAMSAADASGNGLFVVCQVRRTIKAYRTRSRLFGRRAYSAPWQKRRVQSCRPTMGS
jgi:hypothetical protein